MVQTRSKKVVEEPHGYEFLGPPGAFFISFLLPVIAVSFPFVCNDISGCPAPSLLSPSTFSLAQFKEEIGWPGLAALFDSKVIGWTIVYYFANAILWTVLPGEETQGTVLRSGGRLSYKLNAFSSTLVTLGALGVGTLVQGRNFPVWSWIWDNFPQFLVGHYLVSLAVATFVYVRSFQIPTAPEEQNREFSAGGVTGNLLYDWFHGRELNPRVNIPLIGEIDLKEFMELRPGMLLWIILDLTAIHHQYTTFGTITDSILITTAFHATYALDALRLESQVLTTMDIIQDGFGMMLAVGDLVWVPFIYSFNTRYLAMYPLKLGFAKSSGILAICGFGFWVYRASNNQKNAFRNNPNDPSLAHLESISTKSGGKLIVSGWWGISRHINYFGDWLWSWGYCLPTGVSGFQVLPAIGLGSRKVLSPGAAEGWAIIITYFYMIFFTILLLHRERRDDAKCQRKYGADWEEYKKRVKWRILPGIY